MSSKLRIVEIEWEDAAHTPGWWSPEDMKESAWVARCRTIGYLIRRDRHVVQVVQNRYDMKKTIKDAWGECMSIPASCVRRIRFLK